MTGNEGLTIGITYDLREEYLAMGYTEDETAEFDSPGTIDAIEGALRELGYQAERIGHIKSLTKKLASGARWDVVFNIAEGMHGLSRESQAPALLDAFSIPYTFSDAIVLGISLHKGLTKIILRSFGIPTPDFAVVSAPEDIGSVNLPFPLFAKPVAEGTGKGITADSKISNAEELDSVCRQLLSTYKQPVLVETFLPGREYTVGVVGTGDNARALGALEIILNEKAEKDVYSYVNKEKCEELVKYVLVSDEGARQCCEIAVKAWKAMGCRDAGRIDFRVDSNGIPNFLEVNPLAGLNPFHSDLPILCTELGIPYVELIRMIMESAKERLIERSSGN